MTSRSEQTLGYVILGLFSIIALFPIAGIVLTAIVFVLSLGINRLAERGT